MDRGGEERKDRGILVLTLIVLVWNAALHARHSFLAPAREGAMCPSHGPVRDRPAVKTPEPPLSAVGAVGAMAGRLTPRQRFLLGQKVDVNRDPWERITELPGLSDAVSREIVARRKREGTFRRPDDLLTIRGIKEKRLQKILPFLAPFPNN